MSPTLMNLQNEVMVFDASRRSFSSKLQQVGELAAGEVLVRVRCCTICGSDLHTYSGRRAGPTRCVLGHEIIGDIVSWAGDQPPKDYLGNALEVGQRVTWTMAVGCGDCFFCQNRLTQKCEQLFKYGHEFDDGRIATGGLATYCLLVANTQIFPIPDELNDRVATPANCATATVCAAMRTVRQTHAMRESRVLVIGLGMLGLTALAAAVDCGAATVVAFDPDPDRAQLALEFGASHIATSENELTKLSSGITKGRGFDVVFDFAGVDAAVQAALEHVRIGGCVLLAGSVFPTGNISVNPESLVRRMVTLHGLHNYLPQDLKTALDLLVRIQDQFPFGDLVSRTYELQDTARAFEFARDHRPIRIAIACEKTS